MIKINENLQRARLKIAESKEAQGFLGRLILQWRTESNAISFAVISQHQ